eukprot:scaffold18.g1892.t1
MGGASLVFGALALFIASEKSFLHLSRNARRIFWYLFSCALTVWLIRWVHSLEGAGMAWVLLSATLAASVVEDEVSKKLGLTMLNIEATQRLRAALRSPEAQGKASARRGGCGAGRACLASRARERLWRTRRAPLCAPLVPLLPPSHLRTTVHPPTRAPPHIALARPPRAQAERVMDIVSSISRGRGYTLGAKQLVGRVSGTTARLQRTLRRVLEGAEEDELNYLLCTINCPAMVEVCGHATMDLLVRERLPELTTVARAVLVDALQKLGLRYRPRRQQWARDVLVNTHGLQLGSIQTEVAEHFKTEGQALAAEFRRYSTTPGVMLKARPLPKPCARACPREPCLLGACRLRGFGGAGARSRHGARPPWAGGGAGAGAGVRRRAVGARAQVVSDIDDTLFSSGGSWPAGIDNRYPKKCYYPGALTLYTELDRCFTEKHQKALQRLMAAEEAAGRVPRPPPAPPAAAVARRRQAAEADEGAGGWAEEGAGAGPHTSATPPVPVPAGPPPRSPSPPAERAGSVEGRESSSGWPLRRSESAATPRSPSPAQTPASSAMPSGSVGGSLWGESSIANGGNGGSARTTGRSALTSSLSSALRPLHVPRPEVTPPPRPPPEPGPGPPHARTHQEGSNLGLTEAEAYSKYFEPLVGRELRTAPSMLTGSLSSGPKALLHYVLGWAPPEVADNPRTASSALFQTLAAKKLSRFREFAAAWPECCFLFLGDNGQGDVLCAEVLWSSMRPGAGGGGKSRLLACLVHKVAPIAATYSMVRSKAGDKATWITAWKQRNIHLSKSHAFTLGLLDVQGLHRKDLKTARYYLPPEMGLPSLLLAEAAAGSLAGAPPPPPSPARSLLGSSPPSVSFHRMYGWTASMTEHAEAVMD